MDNQIVLSQEELQNMLNIAVNQDRNSTDDIFIKITGCGTVCTQEYEINVRNEDKEKMALRLVFNHLNINMKMGFHIMRDYGFIENPPIYKRGEDGCYKRDKEGNKIHTGDINVNKNQLTVDGFRELNGTAPQSGPMIGDEGGNMYVDMTDERYDNLISKIKEHPDFEEKRIYNAGMKNKKKSYNRHELELAEQLNVEIIEQKELTE